MHEDSPFPPRCVFIFMKIEHSSAPWTLFANDVRPSIRKSSESQKLRVQFPSRKSNRRTEVIFIEIPRPGYDPSKLMNAVHRLVTVKIIVAILERSTDGIARVSVRVSRFDSRFEANASTSILADELG